MPRIRGRKKESQEVQKEVQPSSQSTGEVRTGVVLLGKEDRLIVNSRGEKVVDLETRGKNRKQPEWQQVERANRQFGRDKPQNRPEYWIPLVLEEIEKTGLIRISCERIGLKYSIFNEYQREHPEFRLEVIEAKKRSTEHLELVARERAVNYSDTLLIFLLKANDPEKFGDRLRIDASTVRDQAKKLAEQYDLDEEELVNFAEDLARTLGQPQNQSA